MPTYEYQCNACDHAFDEFQFMSEEPLTKCPQCGRKKLRRLPGTGAGLIFKGSGFYETDYRSDTYKEAAKADAPAAKAEGGDKTATAAPAGPDTGGGGKKGKADSPKSTPRGADD